MHLRKLLLPLLVLPHHLRQVVSRLLQLDHQLVVLLVHFDLRVHRLLVLVDGILHLLLGVSQLFAKRASVGSGLQKCQNELGRADAWQLEQAGDVLLQVPLAVLDLQRMSAAAAATGRGACGA